MSSFNDTSIITFHDLNQRQEQDDHYIGRDDIGSYVAVPELGIEVITLLQKELTVGEVKQILKEKYEEDIEVDPFINTLIQLKFVKAIDSTVLEDNRKKKKYLFTSTTSHHVSWLFSTPAFVVYTGVCIAALIIMGINHSYIPRHQDIFFHPRFTIILLIAVILSWLLVFKHEMAHLFALKSLGLQGKFSLSHRLHFVVAETDMTQLWMKPRKDRYLPYAAGMISDVVTASSLVVVLWVSDAGLFFMPDILYNICKFIILSQFIGILWQFQFFMRTDVYYILSTALNCKNLYGDAQTVIKNHIYKIMGKSPQPIEGVSKKEMKAIRIYSVFLALGTGSVLAIVILYVIPILYTMVTEVYTNIVSGYIPGNKQAFIDGVILTGIMLFQWGLLIFLIVKNYKRT
ncbi:MAG: hypothetical protein PVF58_07980 [Candidatus Methanofastidiosia archaeon]|jgi:hypothetical protein